MKQEYFSPLITRQIESSLQSQILSSSPLIGGMNERTLLIKTERGEFVVRTEAAGGFQLRRAYQSQHWAHMAGVMVPEVIAYSFDAEETQWIVEEKVLGNHFVPEEMTDDDARKTAIDLGRQLKKLHSLECDRFGLIPIYPYSSYEEWEKTAPEEVKRSEELTGPVFRHGAEYLAFKTGKIESALALINADQKTVQAVKEVYAELSVSEKAHFCGGDTATSNILVRDGKVTALIDMEWARGGDPAENIASWSYWNQQGDLLDAFLEGYQPERFQDLKRNILLSEIMMAVSLIQVYQDMNDNKGIAETKGVVYRKLEEKRWE